MNPYGSINNKDDINEDDGVNSDVSEGERSESADHFIYQDIFEQIGEAIIANRAQVFHDIRNRLNSSLSHDRQ